MIAILTIWAFVFGFGCGGLTVSLAWLKSAERLKKRTDEIFGKYKDNLAEQLKHAIDELEKIDPVCGK